MKKLLLLVILALIMGCEKEPGDGRLKIEVYDNPPPVDAEHIYIEITEVSVHSSDEGWQTLVQSPATYDFLKLVNGVTAVLCDVPLEPGHYTQIRLVVADTSEVIINNISYPLVVPSGVETGVKLSLAFDVEEDELIEILVDFDASKSITWSHPNYLLRPAFRAFKKVLSGTVSGTIKDTAGVGIPNALVEAMSGSHTSSTITDSLGAYKLVLIEGTYNLEASADGYTTADTTYTGVVVKAGEHLTGYDFVLE